MEITPPVTLKTYRVQMPISYNEAEAVSMNASMRTLRESLVSASEAALDLPQGPQYPVTRRRRLEVSIAALNSCAKVHEDIAAMYRNLAKVYEEEAAAVAAEAARILENM